MISQDQIKAVIERIAVKYNPERILLFGSYANGTPNENSDLDLLIVNDSTKDNKVLQREIRRDLLRRDFALDLLVCNPHQIKNAAQESLSFLNQIATSGRIIYERK
ncbi:MAG: nucleotidyltransferase domain-containing protein [Cytophagales bacterium]